MFPLLSGKHNVQNMAKKIVNDKHITIGYKVCVGVLYDL